MKAKKTPAPKRAGNSNRKRQRAETIAREAMQLDPKARRVLMQVISLMSLKLSTAALVALNLS